MTGTEIVLLVLVVMSAFAIAGLGMAIGWLLANKPIKGSCGGLATMTDESGNSICMACGDDPADCSGDEEQVAHATALASEGPGAGGPDASICDRIGCSVEQRAECSAVKQAACDANGGPCADEETAARS